MSTLSDLQMYGRFLFGLAGFLRRRMTVEEAREAIRRGLAGRDDNFLRVVRRGIFENPSSPYLPLLKLAREVSFPQGRFEGDSVTVASLKTLARIR